MKRALVALLGLLVDGPRRRKRQAVVVGLGALEACGVAGALLSSPPPPQPASGTASASATVVPIISACTRPTARSSRLAVVVVRRLQVRRLVITTDVQTKLDIRDRPDGLDARRWSGWRRKGARRSASRRRSADEIGRAGHRILDEVVEGLRGWPGRSGRGRGARRRACRSTPRLAAKARQLAGELRVDRARADDRRLDRLALGVDRHGELELGLAQTAPADRS